MKTLQINTERGWRGGESQTLYLAKGLNERSHKTIIIAQPESGLYFEARKKGVPVIPVLMKSEFDIRAILKISKIMKSEGIDICHMHTPHSVSLGAISAKLSGVPVKIVSRRVDFSLRKNPFRKLKYEWAIDMILAISEGVKKVLVIDGISPNKISIVYEGVDLSEKQVELSKEEILKEFGIKNGTPIAGNIAHLTDHKGHKYLLNAIPLVLKRVPDACFFILGKGELENELKEQARRLGIEKSVIFTGFRNEVSSFLKSFDFFVISSHLEGLCTSILDAMASGLPVVATRAGGIPELVVDGETGLLVPVMDSEKLAEAMIELFINKEKALKMGRNGLELVKQFSSDNMVENTIGIYKKILNSKTI